MRPCIFQPGNFTGSGSDGVNVSLSTVADVNEKMSTTNGFDAERSLQLTRRTSSFIVDFHLSLSTVADVENVYHKGCFIF